MENGIDFIVKLGGGAITKKEELECMRVPALQRAAEILTFCRKQGLKFIVVHGAGSFGHFQAKKYAVNGGYSIFEDADDQDLVKEGFCATRQSVCKLNYLVTQALIETGVHAVSQSPCGQWEMDKGVVVQDTSEKLWNLLECGFTPVLHGDCVLDKSLGCKILSGDTIIQVLCEKFSPKRVVFMTDAAGIYDSPPDNPDSKLIPVIRVNADGSINIPISTSVASNDVTGGVDLKIRSAAAIVKQSQGKVPVFICNAFGESMKNACMKGYFGNKLGTLVTLAS